MEFSASPKGASYGKIIEASPDDPQQFQEPEAGRTMTEADMMKALTGTLEATRTEEQEITPGLPKHWLVDSWTFSSMISLIVVINAIQMGFEVDYPDLIRVWKPFNYTVAAVFFLEMLLKLACLRSNYFCDTWNWLDGSLASMGFLDTWVILIVGDLGHGVSLSQFSILRLLRLLRLMRLARLFRQFRKLAVVIKSIVDAMESSLWVASLLAICIYVCAIFCVGFIGRAPQGTYPGYTEDPDEIDSSEVIGNFNPHLVFGSMSTAMMSLFNIAIMAEWTEIVRPVLLKQPKMAFFFLAFSMVAAFGIMNVVIGMICDNVMQNSRALEDESEQRRFNEKTRIIQQVKDIIFHEDKGGHSHIDMKEVKILLKTKDDRIREIMSKLNLPAGCTPEEFIDLLDNNGNGKLEKDEFCDMFSRLMSAGEFERTCMLQMGVNKIQRVSKGIEDTLNMVQKQLAEHSLLSTPLCKDDTNLKARTSTARSKSKANTPSLVSIDVALQSLSRQAAQQSSMLTALYKDSLDRGTHHPSTLTPLTPAQTTVQTTQRSELASVDSVSPEVTESAQQMLQSQTLFNELIKNIQSGLLCDSGVARIAGGFLVVPLDICKPQATGNPPLRQSGEAAARVSNVSFQGQKIKNLRLPDVATTGSSYCKGRAPLSCQPPN